MADGLASGAYTIWVAHRQHYEARLRVFIAIEPRNGKEVRQLPEEQNRKERPAFARNIVARRSPAHQRRQRSWNRANGSVQGRDSLERSVNQNITEQRDGAENTREQVHQQRKM